MTPSACRSSIATGSTLVDISTDAQNCRRCGLYRDATQIVFGEGPADARIVMVGEQPGDHEDLSGRPFVGPAGLVLGKALSIEGVARESIYLTNAVKHFKHEDRGKRRLHKRPNSYEIEQCACRGRLDEGFRDACASPWAIATLA